MRNHLNAPCEKGEMVCIVCELAQATLMSTNQPQGRAPIFFVNVKEKVVVVHLGRYSNKVYYRLSHDLVT